MVDALKPMPSITRAKAIAHNEVAYLAWAIAGETIPGCLGFDVVREYLDAHDQVTAERPLASYVAFKVSETRTGNPRTPRYGPCRNSPGAT